MCDVHVCLRVCVCVEEREMVYEREQQKKTTDDDVVNNNALLVFIRWCFAEIQLIVVSFLMYLACSYNL